MTNIFATSPTNSERTNNLLGKSVQSYRQAYSDRTAWLMACLSELAYIKFNPLFQSENHKKWFLDAIKKLVGDDKKSSLIKLIDMVGYDSDKEKSQLTKELNLLKFQLVATFDCSGTQAILVSQDQDKFIVLAFRGTEAMSITDIKTDAKAKTTWCETGGKIHKGFSEAFEKVAMDIQNKINEPQFGGKPLFITGHSLGGALATVAAKKLSHEGGIAACYTFGSPRIGDDEWIASMKTPVYRVVNAADCVTMMPPGKVIIDSLCFIMKRIPHVGETIRAWLSRFGGYLHCGDMRYLTNCRRGQYDDVKLLYGVSFFYRIKGFTIGKVRWNRFLADHSICIYRKKLMVVAEKRNPSDNTN